MCDESYQGWGHIMNSRPMGRPSGVVRHRHRKGYRSSWMSSGNGKPKQSELKGASQESLTSSKIQSCSIIISMAEITERCLTVEPC